jgi:hypothetical protein
MSVRGSEAVTATTALDGTIRLPLGSTGKVLVTPAEFRYVVRWVRGEFPHRGAERRRSARTLLENTSRGAACRYVMGNRLATTFELASAQGQDEVETWIQAKASCFPSFRR